jgi:hypothetical protein
MTLKQSNPHLKSAAARKAALSMTALLMNPLIVGCSRAEQSMKAAL